MTDETPRGAVYSQRHYDLSKNLDHSCWQKGQQQCWQPDAPRLDRNITASDLDSVFCRLLNDPVAVPAVFDNNGKMIFAELSSSFDDWRLVKEGQFRLYRGLLDGPHCAVLCRHQVQVHPDPEQQKRICTRHDIISFQPMVWDHGPIIGSTQKGNRLWQEFVFLWFNDPVRLRRVFIGLSVGLIRQPVLRAVT